MSPRGFGRLSSAMPVAGGRLEGTRGRTQARTEVGPRNNGPELRPRAHACRGRKGARVSPWAFRFRFLQSIFAANMKFSTRIAWKLADFGRCQHILFLLQILRFNIPSSPRLGNLFNCQKSCSFRLWLCCLPPPDGSAPCAAAAGCRSSRAPQEKGRGVTWSHTDWEPGHMYLVTRTDLGSTHAH